MPVNFELLENIVNSDYVLDIDKDTNEIIDTGIEREYLKPEIINPESNFVVVTYWWGRGRDNANIARPCMSYYEVIISDIKSYTIEYFERIYRSKLFRINSPEEVLSNFADIVMKAKDFDNLMKKLTNQYFDEIYWGLSNVARDEDTNEIIDEQVFLDYKKDKKTYYRVIEKLKAKKENDTSPMSLLLTQNNPNVETEENARLTIKNFIKSVAYVILKLIGDDLLKKFYIYESVEKLKNMHMTSQLVNEETMSILNDKKVEFKQIDENITKLLKNKTTYEIDGIKYDNMNIFDILNVNLRWESAVKYEKMIDIWRRECEKCNCNYLSVEYNEFTRPGGYQEAINAKPLFIKKALQLCEGRSVLYIDGDMFVRKYPNIFDTPNVDFMARGWNIDPRASWTLAESITYDPYKFETSGGIMYFSQSIESINLLNDWIKITSNPINDGKADDRLLSVIFNTKRYMLNMNIIQLPIEYLWLSLTYDERMLSLPYSKCSDGISKTKHECLSNEDNEWYDAAGGYDWDYFEMSDSIFIEHPECLTSEETAKGAGASSDRTPIHHAFLDNEDETVPVSENFYEYIFFEKESDVNELRTYIDFMNNNVIYLDDGNEKYYELELVDPEDESNNSKPLYVIDYNTKYGDRNTIAMKNEEWFLNNSIRIPDNLYNIKVPGSDIILLCENDLFNTKSFETISFICGLLDMGKSVIYRPSNCGEIGNENCYLELVSKNTTNMDLVFFPVLDTSIWKHMLKPKINTNQPIYFGKSNSYSLLSRILKMFSSIEDLSNYLNKGSYQIISRIRIKYLFKNQNFDDDFYLNVCNKQSQLSLYQEPELELDESVNQSKLSRFGKSMKSRFSNMFGGSNKYSDVTIENIRNYISSQCNIYKGYECGLLDNIDTDNIDTDIIDNKEIISKRSIKGGKKLTHKKKKMKKKMKNKKNKSKTHKKFKKK